METRTAPELNRIYQGDCAEVMRSWPDECVDLIVTDPPYGMNKFKGDEKDFLEIIGPSFQEWPRLLKPKGAAFVFMSTGEVVNLANRVPLKFRRMLWMYKPADMTFPLEGWLLTSEAILWFSKNGTSNLRDRKPYKHDCYQATQIGREGVEGHPTVKPLSVVKDLVFRCAPGGVVLDPFLGSGTTAVAAEEIGDISWLGIEQNPDYCKIAQGRIDRVRAQGRLF